MKASYFNFILALVRAAFETIRFATLRPKMDLKVRIKYIISISKIHFSYLKSNGYVQIILKLTTLNRALKDIGDNAGDK